jgi:hypothetical protein
MLDMLAGDSSDSALAKTVTVATIPEPEEAMDTQRPEGARPKHLCQVGRPTAPAEGKKRKRDNFGGCRGWMMMLALLLLLLKKY